MWNWMKIIGLSGFCIMGALLLAGIVYQSLATRRSERIFTAPGQLIDVGGYRLHLHCTGDKGPTVILDAGLGASSLEWSLVQTEVSKFARVCSYDRAGYGWSDESPLERTSENIVEELHSLLKNSGEISPYTLVGHSFGGTNILLYATKYPEEVAGVVLVDSSHEDQPEVLPDLPQSFTEKLLINPTIAPFLTSIGLTRLFINTPESKAILKDFPAETQNAYLAGMSTTKYSRTMTQEFHKFNQSSQQLKKANPSLHDKPLIVITAGKPLDIGDDQEFNEELTLKWNQLQKDHLKKSAHSKQVIAEHSSHMITREQPEIIIGSIHEIVTSVP